MNIEDRIRKNVKAVVEDVREYFRNQKDDWQKLPWLALQANGRGGWYNSFFGYLYEYGVLPIQDNEMAIDLETGELVTLDFHYESIEVLGNGEGDKFKIQFGSCGNARVLNLATKLGSYDAKKEVKRFQKLCEENDNIEYHGVGFKTNEEWRNATIEKYDLKKDSYSRRKMG